MPNPPQTPHSNEVLLDKNIRSEYRRRLANALWKVSRYKGQEKEREAILQTLIDLENWLIEVFGLGADSRFDANLEQLALSSIEEVMRKEDLQIEAVPPEGGFYH